MLSVVTKVGMAALHASAAYLTYDAIATSMAKPIVELRPNYSREAMTASGVLVATGLAYGLYRRRSKKALVVKKNKNMLTTESVRAESELDPRTMPSCQVIIAIKDGDVLTPIGCGIRTEYGIWTLDHIVAGLDKIWLLKGSTQVEIDLKMIGLIEFGLESVCLKVDEGKMSQLGLAKAKFGPLPSAGKMVTIVGPYGKGSMSILKRNTFGHVTYEGSTTAGFSGAPYMYNRTVIGMHSHGGKENGGMEILYLKAMYHLNENIVLENSEDFFKKFVEQEEDAYYEEVGDDIVVADQQGHYHVAKGDLAKTVRESRKSKKKAYTPEDYNAEYVAGGWADEPEEEGWSKDIDLTGESARKEPSFLDKKASEKKAPPAPSTSKQVTASPNKGQFRPYQYTGRPQYLTTKFVRQLVQKAVRETVKDVSQKPKPTVQQTPV